MIAFLGVEHGLSPVDAYILCSVAGDLRMHEVVSIGCVYKGLMDVDHVTLFALGRHA